MESSAGEDTTTTGVGGLSSGYSKRNKVCPRSTEGWQLKQLVTRMGLLWGGGESAVPHEMWSRQKRIHS